MISQEDVKDLNQAAGALACLPLILLTGALLVCVVLAGLL